jgi:hypothetical protein
MPGKPWANVEKSRLKIHLKYEIPVADWKPQTGDKVTLSSDLEFDDSPFEPDHCGVGSVVGAQLGEDVLDTAFDSFFGD